jgi:hypothetical protein
MRKFKEDLILFIVVAVSLLLAITILLITYIGG